MNHFRKMSQLDDFNVLYRLKGTWKTIYDILCNPALEGKWCKWYRIIVINVREYRRGNQKCTIQRNCQDSVPNTQDEWQTRQKHKTICVVHHYTQTNTNNVNKTWALLQTTGGKDEPNIVLWWTHNEHHNTEPRT
jgi:hypothetical protein